MVIKTDSAIREDALLQELGPNSSQFESATGRRIDPRINRINDHRQIADQTESRYEMSALQGFLFNLESRFALVLLILGIFGILLIFIAIVVENHGRGLNAEIITLFVKEMGILLFAIVTTSLVHDRFLRSHSLKEVENALNIRIRKSALTAAVAEKSDVRIAGERSRLSGKP